VEAERRQVTILFADMVSFTSFSERSGEEAAYTLMRSLSKLMDDAVQKHGGVVQLLEDPLLFHPCCRCCSHSRRYQSELQQLGAL
jgi:hypothetical protein